MHQSFKETGLEDWQEVWVSAFWNWQVDRLTNSELLHVVPIYSTGGDQTPDSHQTPLQNVIKCLFLHF